MTLIRYIRTAQLVNQHHQRS